MKRKIISFLITEEEKETLESVIFLEPFLQDNIRGVRATAGKLRISFEESDLSDVIGALQHMARYENAQRYNALAQKLELRIHNSYS